MLFLNKKPGELKMERSELLKSKLSNIKKGAKYFGIIGRLSILWGLLFIIIGVASLYSDFASSLGSFAKTTIQGVWPLITGYLFLLGRDAFESIAVLIEEIGEIV